MQDHPKHFRILENQGYERDFKKFNSEIAYALLKEFALRKGQWHWFIDSFIDFSIIETKSKSVLFQRYLRTEY